MCWVDFGEFWVDKWVAGYNLCYKRLAAATMLTASPWAGLRFQVTSRQVTSRRCRRNRSRLSPGGWLQCTRAIPLRPGSAEALKVGRAHQHQPTQPLRLPGPCLRAKLAPWVAITRKETTKPGLMISCELYGNMKNSNTQKDPSRETVSFGQQPADTPLQVGPRQKDLVPQDQWRFHCYLSGQLQLF